MAYKILTDADVEHLYDMKLLIQAVERALTEKAHGTLVSPPRFHLETAKGNLVFTAGAATESEQVIGFRVYDTFANADPGHEQLVSVFDSETGILKGIVIGNLLGAVRTGALGGAAINAMARADAKQVAVLGTGLQARTQLQAAAAVRDVKRVHVYSRNLSNRQRFAQAMTERLHMDVVPFNSPKECVESADIVICATNSRTPVFDAGWLKPGAHVNTLGPKSVRGQEVPMEAVDMSNVLATDSLEQLQAYPTPHFLMDSVHEARVVQLSDIVVGSLPGRRTAGDITIFFSVGLSGTEVVVANEIMKSAVQ